MTFEENFTRVKKKFDGIDKKKFSAINENIAMEVNITNDDSNGLFYIAYLDGEFKVEPYNYFDHTVRISADADDVIKLIDRKTSLDNLIKKGSIVVEKNIEHARKIFELKDKPAKKIENTKKAAVKKTTEKVSKVVKKVDAAAQKAKEKIDTISKNEDVIKNIKKAEEIAKTAEKKVETVASKVKDAATEKAEKAVNAAKSKVKKNK